jgi:hypothetical protein
MSTGGSQNAGIFGSFPYEVVITPATVAGLVVSFSQYLLGVAIGINLLGSIMPVLSNIPPTLTVEWVALTLISSITMIGLFVAVLAIVVSGARNDVLLVGAILTYVAGLVSILLAYIYLGQSPDISTALLLSPLSPVILVIGVGIGVNWIGVDVSL